MSEGHPEVELAELYALGALTARERAAFAQHLGGCGRCRAAVAEANAVMAALAAYPPQMAAPPAAAARLLAALPADARRRAWPGWVPALVGGLVIALCSSGALLWQSHTWQARMARVERAQSEFTANADTALAQVGAGAHSTQVALAGTAAAPQASARAVLVRGTSGGLLLLTANGLRPPTRTEVYQLWLIDGSHHTSAGVLTVTPAGQGILSARLPQGITVQALGITAEPHGPAPQPYGVKVLGGLVAAAR